MIPLTDFQQETASCVYQLNYGDRFLIIKGKTLAGSLYFFERGYAQFIAAGGGQWEFEGGKGQKEWDGVNVYYMKAYKYIHDHPGLPWTVTVLLEDDNGYNLLKFEEQMIRKYMQKAKCLNSNVTAYIPKFNEKSGMYGWISKKDVASFRRYLSA